MTVKSSLLSVVLTATLGGAMILPSSVLAGGVKPIKLQTLKNVETIAPITVVFNRKRAAGTQESGPDLSPVAAFKFARRAPLSEEETAFYDSFTQEMLEFFATQTGKSIVPIDTERLVDLPQVEYDTKYVVMEPYLHFTREDAQTLGEAAKRLGVDAVALFDFKYFKYKKGMGIPLVASAKTKFVLKCDLFIVDQSGKLLVKGEIDSDAIIGKQGHDFAGIVETGKFNPEFYSQLQTAWFNQFDHAFK